MVLCNDLALFIQSNKEEKKIKQFIASGVWSKSCNLISISKVMTYEFVRLISIKKKQFIVIFFFFLKKIKKRHKSHFKRLYFTFVKKMCLLINNSGRCNKWRYLHRNSPDPNVDRHIFDGLRHRWLIEQFATPWLQFSIFLHYALFCSFNRAYSFQFVNNRFIQKTNSKK